MCGNADKKNDSTDGWAAERCKHEKFYLRNTVLCKKLIGDDIQEEDNTQNENEENHSEINNNEIETVTETTTSSRPEITTEILDTVETTITSL